MTTSADPAALLRYAERAAGLDRELDRLRADLESVAATAAPATAARIADLLPGLAGLVRRERATTAWVGGVGRAFARADAGGTPLVAGRAGQAPLGAGAGAGSTLTDRYRASRARLRRARDACTDPARRRRLTGLLAPDRRTGRPRQFLSFDPSGDGRVVEVFGDLHRAAAVAVVVPGVGTDLGNADRTFLAPVHDLARRARRADRAHDGLGVAVIAWLGYDPPDGLRTDPRQLLELARADAARRGGRALSRTVRGLRLRSDQHVTLIGHSYGSTTVAAALLAGAPADRVVVMGSPGVLVERAADFHRPGTEFFTMEAPGDVIADLSWFGGDPNRAGSGFRPLDTGGSGHGAYLTPGSRAQAELVAVLLGRRDRPGRGRPGR